MQKQVSGRSGVLPTLTSLLFELCLALTVLTIGAYGQVNEAPTGIPSIVVKNREQVDVPDYGAQIEVYEVANEGATGQSGRRLFCFLPHPILVEKSLKNSFHNLESSITPADKQSTKLFTIPVQWSYQLNRVKALIATNLSARYQAAITPYDVQTMPLNAFTVYALVNGDAKTLLHVPDIEGGSANQLPSELQEPAQGTLTATYSDLQVFVTNPMIGARGYITAARLKTTAISISGAVFSNAGFRDQVNGAGGLTQTITSQSAMDGVGIAIPVASGIFAGNASKFSGTGSSSINRFVSRHFVQSALESGNAKLTIQRFSDAHLDQSVDDVEKQLLAFALTAMTHITARFEKAADDTYKVHVDSLNADLGTNMKLSQIAAATKGGSEFDADLQTKVSTGKISVEDAKKLTNNAKNDISWSASGDIMVPSTVDLYYATDDQFSQTIKTQFVSNEASYADYVYDSPATVTTSPDNPMIEPAIGTIVASMIPWEAQTATFREHWLPADGRDVSSSTQYVALMNRLRPANSPPLTAMQVPDLRGEFLRGLNIFDRGGTPANIDPFDRENNRPRRAGEKQGDAIRIQDLRITSLHNFKHGGDAGGGDHVPIPADPSGYQSIPVQLDPSVPYDSYETRPTNIAVYYYICVN